MITGTTAEDDYGRYRMKGISRFPAFLLVLVVLIASCGGGGGSPPPLVVNTDNATNIVQNSALLNGTVNGNGVATEIWFAYGTNPNLVSPDNTTTQIIAAGTVNQLVNTPLSDLTSGTTYYFRLMASNLHWRAEGEILSFTTHNPPPAVNTDNATSITLNGATLNGSVNPNGAATMGWFEYGQDPNLVSFTATDNRNLGSGRNPVPMDNTLSGLNTGVTFYYRMAAASVEGEVKGEIKSFSTRIPPPAATTGSATGITTTGATFSGTVNPNGYSTEAWFEYGLDNSLATFTATTTQLQGSGTTTLQVSATPIAPLNSWSTYYFRMVARSITDPSVFTKGAIRSFPTGEYYVAVGDSITWGSHDDIPIDDTSLDGRNSGGGFEPILNNLLTAAKGFPHNIVNAGVSGYTSADGTATISTTLSNHPKANYFLIMYGTNDAWIPPIPSGKGLNSGSIGYSGSYKDHMQQIISAVLSAGKTPYLAKVPYSSQPLISDAAIREYNTVVDELVVANGITVTPPDFYAWFLSNPTQLADTVHPDGTGYQSMAGSIPNPFSWFNSLH